MIDFCLNFQNSLRIQDRDFRHFLHRGNVQKTFWFGSVSMCFALGKGKSFDFSKKPV